MELKEYNNKACIITENIPQYVIDNLADVFYSMLLRKNAQKDSHEIKEEVSWYKWKMTEGENWLQNRKRYCTVADIILKIGYVLRATMRRLWLGIVKQAIQKL